MQPVVIVHSGRLPRSAAAEIARATWRYRSELAPLPAAGMLFAAGWWAHLAAPDWYPVFIFSSALAAWLLLAFGGWLGLPRLADRAYFAAAVFAAGGWVAFAALLGPLTPPLPLVLGIVALLLAVPWWADRRRRARARLQRTLSDWASIARAVGLPGSALRAVTLDPWGWRAWLRLAPGQTIEDVAARIPAIESALGAVRGTVRVYPARGGRADWCELHALGQFSE